MMISKPTKIVSKKIRNSAKGENCTLRQYGCQHTGTVVFCHLNSRFKGIGNKSPDLFGVYGCMNCHSALDKGEVSRATQLRALQETQMKLYDKGLIKIKGVSQ